MRTYLIYLIKDEIAEYFYGNERKFYKLFKTERRAFGQLKQIVQKQIAYITKPLPYLELHQLLSQSVNNKQIYIKNKVYCTGNVKETTGAEMAIEETLIHLHGWGGFESESIFFEILRKFDGRFFAIDVDDERYGWIKPVKERKYI